MGTEKAYVMIDCDKGFDANAVRGVEASSMNCLEDAVTKIRKLDSVNSTLTMLVAK